MVTTDTDLVHNKKVFEDVNELMYLLPDLQLLEAFSPQQFVVAMKCYDTVYLQNWYFIIYNNNFRMTFEAYCPDKLLSQAQTMIKTLTSLLTVQQSVQDISN